MSSSVLLSFTAAAAPALILVFYFYHQDKHKPEPKHLILQVFILGVLSTIPLIALDLYLTSLELYLKIPNVPYNFFVAFFQAGFCEELIKLLVVMLFIYRHHHFDEVADGIVYTITASLGFACMENILYVVGKPFNVAVARAVTAVPFHAVCSGVMGYYIGRAKFVPDNKKAIAFISKGFFWAFIMHGIYDFLLFVSPIFGSLYAILIVPVIYIVYKKLQDKMKRALNHDVRNRRI